ncbi:hypothetical protein PBT88_03905 [Sphingomonas abietis]|uniref:Uncharacterized protein n=1 Tax=Sphingomonas abietis TaxID=3012344 RepID=A0ABY7NP31_9SPHN|nr:hypothetical protein PBT88_03905 [Sphingomonas abietis]
MHHHPTLAGLPIEIALLGFTLLLAIVNLFWAAQCWPPSPPDGSTSGRRSARTSISSAD